MVCIAVVFAEGPYANVGPAGIVPVPAVPENPYMNVDPVNLEQESTLYENIPGKAPPKPQVNKDDTH